MSETRDPRENENDLIRLRTRVRALEAELSRQQQRTKTSEEAHASSAPDTSNQIADEAFKLIRGLTLLGVEQLHLFSEAVNNVAREVLQKNRPEEQEIVRDLARLPLDIGVRALKATSQYLETIIQTMDKRAESNRRS